jgi:hypothetical protein
MPAGAKPGQRRGGRKKGTPNKSTQTVEQMCQRLNCNPHEYMALVVINRVPCGVCRGSNKTPFTKEDGTKGMRPCQSCWGSLMENCSPELRGKMAAELAQYLAAKRKALEVSVEVNVGLVETLRKRFEGIPRTE